MQENPVREAVQDRRKFQNPQVLNRVLRQLEVRPADQANQASVIIQRPSLLQAADHQVLVTEVQVDPDLRAQVPVQVVDHVLLVLHHAVAVLQDLVAEADDKQDSYDI